MKSSYSVLYISSSILIFFFSSLEWVWLFFSFQVTLFVNRTMLDRTFWPNRKIHLNNESVESFCRLAECSVALLRAGKPANSCPGSWQAAAAPVWRPVPWQPSTVCSCWPLTFWDFGLKIWVASRLCMHPGLANNQSNNNCKHWLSESKSFEFVLIMPPGVGHLQCLEHGAWSSEFAVLNTDWQLIFASCQRSPYKSLKVSSTAPTWHINSHSCLSVAHAHVWIHSYPSYCNRRLCRRMQRRLSLSSVMMAADPEESPKSPHFHTQPIPSYQSISSNCCCTFFITQFMLFMCQGQVFMPFGSDFLVNAQW